MRLEYKPEAFAPMDIDNLADALKDAVSEATVAIFKKHLQDGQSTWDKNDPEYSHAKGNKPLFVNSGSALEAISSVQHRYKAIQVEIGNDHVTVKIRLSRKNDGVDIYQLAQQERPISIALPGDEDIAAPYIEAAVAVVIHERGA